MPAPFDHAFFLILVVLFPLRAAFSGLRRLRRASPSELPRVRLSVYREAILVQWGLVAALIWRWTTAGRSWTEIGAVPQMTAGFAIVGALLLIGMVLIVRQWMLALRDDEALAGIARQMSHLEVMLPHDRRELSWFFRLSLTAGICEELLYRGFVIWYLSAWMPIVPAAIVASVIFGFGHAYQGVRGILQTGIFGLIVAIVYLVSGSLLLAIVLHAFVDVYSGHLAFHAFRRRDELAREQAQRHAEEEAARARAVADAEAAEAPAAPAARALPGGEAPEESPAPPAASPATSTVRATSPAPDVVVIGLGAMGSAVAHHLAAAGAKVTGFDRWTPPHDRGSSHGESRLIREAYFEAPFYVPIVQRAYDLWHALGEEAGVPVIRLTGGLMIGPPDQALVSGALHSAESHGLPHERLSAAEVRARFPAFEPPEHTVAIWEPRCGMVFPEAAITAHLSGAARRGAALRFAEPVRGWRADGEGVAIETRLGTQRAAKLVLAAGAWMPGMLGAAALPLRVSRQTLHWFDPAADPERFDPGTCPAWVFEHAPGIFTYGFPRHAGAVKAALHVPGDTVDPDALEREATADEAAALVGALHQYMPAIAGRRVRSAVCMYTNTPDGHFAIDAHPAHEQILIASACSGHGFKFTSALGEACAEMVLGRTPRFDMSPFRIARFAAGGPPRPVRQPGSHD